MNPTLFRSLSLLLCLTAAPAAWAQDRLAYTFFQDTQYPLTFYFLRGEKPGPTIMIQGGIQGDEAAGFVSAQFMSQARVLKGNLIVVPRANVPSINLRKRQVNVDLNRRFDQDYNRFYEDRLARAIRFLLSQSQGFIHLHEGSGFYDPKYRDPLRNPQRYGQSVIIDARTYGGGINLERTVNTALSEINARIRDRNRHFRLFNTRTFDPGTPYPEMRKSLTCYALSTLKIPALAVEVSKDINDLPWKVEQQMRATAVLLKGLGVEVIPPAAVFRTVVDSADHAPEVRVNGRSIESLNTLELPSGAVVSCEFGTPPNAPLAPSLAVFATDRPGVNLLTAPRLALERFSGLEVRADGRRLQITDVRWVERRDPAAPAKGLVFACWLNGKPVHVESGQSLAAVRGDQLILEGVLGSSKAEVLNFKGYVSNPGGNDGQDLGMEIILDPANFLEQYQEGRGEVVRYRVVRETPGTEDSWFFVDVAPRRVQELVLEDDLGRTLTVPWRPDGSFTLAPGRYALRDAAGNGPREKLTAMAGNLPLAWGQSFQVDLGSGLDLTLRQATTFEPLGRMSLSTKNLAQRSLPPHP